MAGDEELPWNVSRCNRLLRPLSSKLAKLRKELELAKNVNQETRTISSVNANKVIPHNTINFTRPANKPLDFEKARDPDWRPGVRGTKKTYGRRRIKRFAGPKADCTEIRHNSRPGEVAFTPLIARMGGRMLGSPLTQGSPLKKYTKNRGPLVAAIDPGCNRAGVVTQDRYKLVQGALEAYANVLHATEEKKKDRRGTNSLMSACLKKLPAYIELEEHFAELDRLEEDKEEDEEDDRDVASEIYEYLESRFEQRRGQGWRLFKHVVRAHGTSLLCSAIADGVITMDSLIHFHHHCLVVGAYDEAEELLLAALPLLKPMSIPIGLRSELFGKSWLYMSTAKAFADRTGRHRFVYDLLGYMVAHGLLPLEWLATTYMRPVWDRLMRTIAEGDQRALASCSHFLETCILAGIGLSDEHLLENTDTGAITREYVPSAREDLRQALNTMYSSLVTVLCSLALAHSGRKEAAGKAIVRRVTWTLDSIAIALASRSNIDVELGLLKADADDLQVFAQRASWTIFGCFLVHLGDCGSEDSMVNLSTSALICSLGDVMWRFSVNGVNSSASLASLPTLISATARGTGRIQQDDGFEQLQRCVSAMTDLSGHRLPHKLWTLKRIALESAAEFANGSVEAQHLRYAKDVEKQMRTSGRLIIMPTPRKSDTPLSSVGGGFRLEDGIGEWVACTPFVGQDNKGLPKHPLRALELLPTPVQSEDEGKAGPLQGPGRDFDSEPILPSSPMLCSSPIKRVARRSTSSLGKRMRASSPFVLVRAKRTQITPPDSPVAFYPELPEEKSRENEKRPKRNTTKTKALECRLRTQRSRTSLNSGLRELRRVTYGLCLDGANDNDSEDELSFGF